MNAILALLYGPNSQPDLGPLPRLKALYAVALPPIVSWNSAISCVPDSVQMLTCSGLCQQ